jgi:hypothetical protein
MKISAPRRVFLSAEEVKKRPKSKLFGDSGGEPGVVGPGFAGNSVCILGEFVVK